MEQDDEGSRGSFDERLKAARLRQGPDPAAPAGPADGQGSALGLGVRVGVELVSALGVGVAIGWALDRWLHTLPLFLVLFLVLGGAAGVANVWRLVGPQRR